MELFKLAKLNDCDGNLTGQWYVYYSYRHPETKQFQRFKKVISNRLVTRTARHAAAHKEIQRINKWLREGNNPFDNDNRRLHVADACLLYLKSIENTLRKRSFYTYRNYVKTLLTYIDCKKLNNLRLEDFSHDNAAGFMDWLKNDHRVCNRTYNNYRVHIKAIFTWLINRGYTDFNPFNGFPKLEQEESELTTLTHEELTIMKLHLSQDNFPLFCISMLIYYCFIRPQELVRLQVKDFDLVSQKIRMSGKTSKNKRTQVIIIPNPVMTYLTRLKNLEAASDMYVFSKELLPGYFQIAPTRLAEKWRKWCSNYNINKKLYHLKHTGVGMALEAGMHVRDLQLQLRHYSLDETQKYLEKFSNTASERLKTGFPEI